jgi:hypothetical protein
LGRATNRSTSGDMTSRPAAADGHDTAPPSLFDDHPRRPPEAPRLEAVADPPVPSAASAVAKPAAEPITSLDGLPVMLTVTEAAKVLRVSRTSAYKLADEWRRSGGTSGLRTVQLGSRLLVRRVDLAAIVGLDEPR